PAHPLAATVGVCTYYSYYCDYYGYTYYRVGNFTSGSDGTYSLHVDPSYGSFYVLTPRPAALYLTPGEQYVYSVYAGTTRTLTFVYPRPAIVTGLVVDDLGNPVAGATVVLGPGDYNAKSAVTDATGAYRLAVDSPSS